MLAQWSRRLTDITFNLFADRSIGLSRKLRHGSHQANPSVVFFFALWPELSLKISHDACLAPVPHTG